MVLGSLKDVLQHILKSDGPWATLFLLVVWHHISYVEKQAEKRLAEKDKEIERLVAQRNRLEDVVLSKRRSSGTNASGH